MTDSDDESIPAPVTMDTFMTAEEKAASTPQLLPMKTGKKKNASNPPQTTKTTINRQTATDLETAKKTLSESDLPDSAEHIKKGDDIIGWKAKVGSCRKSFLLKKYGSVDAMQTEP